MKRNDARERWQVTHAHHMHGPDPPPSEEGQSDGAYCTVSSSRQRRGRFQGQEKTLAQTGSQTAAATTQSICVSVICSTHGKTLKTLLTAESVDEELTGTLDVCVCVCSHPGMPTSPLPPSSGQARPICHNPSFHPSLRVPILRCHPSCFSLPPSLHPPVRPPVLAPALGSHCRVKNKNMWPLWFASANQGLHQTLGSRARSFFPARQEPAGPRRPLRPSVAAPY